MIFFNGIHARVLSQGCQGRLHCIFCSVSLAYERSSQKAADTVSSEQMKAYHAEKHILELETKARDYIMSKSPPCGRVALHTVQKDSLYSHRV